MHRQLRLITSMSRSVISDYYLLLRMVSAELLSDSSVSSKYAHSLGSLWKWTTAYTQYMPINKILKAGLQSLDSVNDDTLAGNYSNYSTCDMKNRIVSSYYSKNWTMNSPKSQQLPHVWYWSSLWNLTRTYTTKCRTLIIHRSLRHT